MNFRIILIFILSLFLINNCLAAESESIETLQVRVESLERKLFAQSNSNQNLYSRVDSLEDAIKSMNNKLEELGKQINNYTSSLANLQNEINSKNSGNHIMETAQPSAEEYDDIISQYAQESTNLDKQPKQPLPPAKAGDATSEFEHAFTLLKNSDYEDAAQEFTAFIAKYPKNEQTGVAYYWLGETFYNRKIYNKAALNYLYSIKYFPEGTKADLCTYKLASSFAKLDRKQEACQSFNNFLERFKKAPSSLVSSAKEEIKKLGCTKS